MPITLCFRGGFFTVLSGGGMPMKVDVHMRMPEEVKVLGPNKKRDLELEACLNSASRVDFVSNSQLRPAVLPIRHVSHITPVDYHGFHKVVGFIGGTVTGAGKPVPDQKLEHLRAVKKRADADEMTAEYERFVGVNHHHDANQRSVRYLIQHFFDKLSARELRRWLPGYCVEVKMSSATTRVIVNGRCSQARSLQNETRIEFPVDPESRIPHYPLNNPHVLEQPPTD
jgi:hypothetical protein